MRCARAPSSLRTASWWPTTRPRRCARARRPGASKTCSAPSQLEPGVTMKTVGIILRRELASYFSTPLAVVVILFFLVLANVFAFFLGSLYERGQADMVSFFRFL